MSLRKFLMNGRLAPLSMSGTGDGAAGGGAGGGSGAGGAGGAGGGAAVYTFDSSKPFAEQLPEKYRADPNFRDIKSVDGLLDGYINAQRLVGADKATLLQLPKDGDEKGLNDFYAKLGRPESADKYTIGKRADGSDYGDADKAMQAKLLPLLHQAGLTQKQLDVIRPGWDGLMAEVAGGGAKAAEAYAGQQIEGLKKDWGAAFDDNMKDAQAAIQHLGNDDLLKELNIVRDGKATGDNAQLMRAFAKIGKQLREDGVLKAGSTPQSGALDPTAAKAEIDKLMKNGDFVKVWRSKGAAGKVDGADMTHEQAVAKLKGLYEFAYPQTD